ncbi:MAG: EamA family transporter RarD [Alphaproteobacteria bacterium]|jgi:chloramphenicol-sensitive protein RarD|nr:EamA family transporter RarD [Alphaproteobacteria bacterium]
MNKISYGYASATSGALIWGMAPLYYRLLNEFPLMEVVAQRAFWSCILFMVVFIIQNRLSELRQALNSFKNISLFIICSALIGTNWLLFIFALNYGQLMQSALGYYIFPLLTAAMGYYFLGERLDKLTKIALLFALAAVLLKGTSLSNFPWIAISMATTFALYAIIRKQLPVKSDTGTLIETIMLAPIAMIYFGWQAQNGAVLFFGADFMGLMLAVFCGLFTIIPLYLFHNGNKMLPLAIAGLIFYLNPTSQLIISIMLGEPFSFIDISVFVLIWTGLLIQFSPMFFKS